MAEEATIGKMWGREPIQPWKDKKNTAMPKTTNDDLMVGLELEIENLPRGQTFYMEAAGSFWRVVEDGSLRPRGESWEFVSAPAKLNRALYELEEFFKKVPLTGVNYTDRCSVHVHTNVNDFTVPQLSNLAMVYPVFERILFQYVNHHKKKEEQGYCRDTNLYCIPWADCRMNRSFINTLINKPSRVRDWQKYTALNLLPVATQGTVEWRHMHGTNDMEKLTTWLNIIGSIMKFSKESSFDDIVKTIKVLNDVSTYQQFFVAVLGDTLPYTEDYRRLMAEGVVNAKWSLMNMDKKEAKKATPIAYDEEHDDWLDRVEEAPDPRFTQAAQERQQARIRDLQERLARTAAAVRPAAMPVDIPAGENLVVRNDDGANLRWNATQWFTTDAPLRVNTDTGLARVAVPAPRTQPPAPRGPNRAVRRNPR